MTDQQFARRTLIATGIVAFVALLVIGAWYVGNVLLVVFGGVLFAIFLRALANPLHRATGIPSVLSVALVALAFIGALVGVGFIVGPALADQMSIVVQRLPESIQVIERWLVRAGWAPGPEVSDRPFDLVSELRARVLAQGEQAVGWATSIVSGLAWTVTATTVILLAGLYFAFQPRLYRGGVAGLAPHRHRHHVGEILSSVGAQLRGWLFGQLASMAVVGVLTGLGLWLLGVPLALVLAVLAFFSAFVPTLGPLAALVVAVLVTLVDSPHLVVYVIGLYTVVQFLESYFITPLIQRQTADIPPALLLATQLVFGVLFGFLGVLLATPLTAAVLVLVRRLYREDVLGDEPPQPA